MTENIIEIACPFEESDSLDGVYYKRLKWFELMEDGADGVLWGKVIINVQEKLDSKIRGTLIIHQRHFVFPHGERSQKIGSISKEKIFNEYVEGFRHCLEFLPENKEQTHD